MSPTKLKEAFEKMSDCDHQTLVPKEVKLFLQRHFDSRQFEDQKKVYMFAKTRKQSKFLDHLVQCYALINFWKHMFLNMIGDSDHSALMIQHSLEEFIAKMIHGTGKVRNKIA